MDDKVLHHYTENGKKKKLFEYKKLYTDSNLKKTVLAIDFFNATFMNEDTYETEYIVEPEFFINELETKCNLVLLDTDTFENQFNKHRFFFENIVEYENNDNTKDFFMKIKYFYNFEDDINKNSFELSRLNRFYIFQKVA